MPPGRVSLVRSMLLPALVAVPLVAVSTAVAATGGAVLPGGVPAAEAGSRAAAEPPPGGPDPVSASQESLPEPTPPAPVLASTARRPNDPVASDVAALVTPTDIAAIDGHVVIVRIRMGHSELVDLADPTRPRVLLISTRDFGTPNAGRDAAGHPVVVVSPCSGTEEVVLLGQTPRCPLRSVDLIDASSRALPSTTGALEGDLAGERLVFTRASPTTGVRLYESTGAAAVPVVLPRLGAPGDGWTVSMGTPSPGSVRATGLDVDAAGRIAVVLEYRSRIPAFASTLWERSGAQTWSRVATVGTGFAGMGTRHLLGPMLDAGGVRAYVEGVIETPSYVGRWNDAGQLTTKLSIRRSIGRSTIAHSAAFDGDRMLFLDWLPGAPCGSEEALACGLRAAAPIAVQ